MDLESRLRGSEGSNQYNHNNNSNSNNNHSLGANSSFPFADGSGGFNVATRMSAGNSGSSNRSLAQPQHVNPATLPAVANRRPVGGANGQQQEEYLTEALRQQNLAQRQQPTQTAQLQAAQVQAQRQQPRYQQPIALATRPTSGLVYSSQSHSNMANAADVSKLASPLTRRSMQDSLNDQNRSGQEQQRSAVSASNRTSPSSDEWDDIDSQTDFNLLDNPNFHGRQTRRRSVATKSASNRKSLGSSSTRSAINDDNNTTNECLNKTRRFLLKVKRILLKTSQITAIFLLINMVVYFLPHAGPALEMKEAHARPRPKFTGTLALNEQLEQAERLFEGQFHAPESMAWTSNKRSFYTGVEGGFILLVEPYEERWTVIARLNSRSQVRDESRGVGLVGLSLEPEVGDKIDGATTPATTTTIAPSEQTTTTPTTTTAPTTVAPKAPATTTTTTTTTASTSFSEATTTTEKPDSMDETTTTTTAPMSAETTTAQPKPQAQAWQTKALLVPFCTRDIEIYGKRAEFEPALVKLSRCSRPLGIRLSPDDTRLYVSDPLSGLYRIDLATNSDSDSESLPPTSIRRNKVSKLIDFSQFQGSDSLKPPARLESEMEQERRVLFADDIAVDWAAAGGDTGDLIYLTDCSLKWPLRYLLWVMLENDDTGRVLVFDTSSKQLKKLAPINPVHVAGKIGGSQMRTDNSNPPPETLVTTFDYRNMSFPNGLELTSNKSALMISDLNNRRILMHHLKGPKKGETHHLLWVPGYSDNVRRGLDQPNGQATYWLACGCAVDDGKWELSEATNKHAWLRRWVLKWLSLVGSTINFLGSLADSPTWQDAGAEIAAGWLKMDPYCRHGLVMQFTEEGEVLRTLHAPHFGSHFKLISEAHQVPIAVGQVDSSINSNSTSQASSSLLYLGSVYYSYLGRLELTG